MPAIVQRFKVLQEVIGKLTVAMADEPYMLDRRGGFTEGEVAGGFLYSDVPLLQGIFYTKILSGADYYRWG
jgi:hypothetical protein